MACKLSLEAPPSLEKLITKIPCNTRPEAAEVRYEKPTISVLQSALVKAVPIKLTWLLISPLAKRNILNPPNKL